MRERVRNVMVGICTIGALAGGSALLFLFGEIEPFLAERWSMKVAFNEAGGLRKGSLVTLNGVPIGAVDRVEIWGDRDHPVLITVAIDDGVLIPDPSTPSVQASLLGSGARLEFSATLPLAAPPKHYPKVSDTPLRGEVMSLESRIASQLDERITPIAVAFEEVGTLARNLNTLVAPTADGAPPNPESLRESIRRLNTTLEQAEGAIASARIWLEDEQLRTDMRDTASGASELMRDAAITANKIGTLADSLAADASELRANALPVLSRAEASLEEFNRLLLAVRTGKGTAGLLVNDPALYDGLTDAAQRLDEALAKLNLLLDKVRAEGIDVELFPK